jgi:uncharacterized membrane protein YhaH (DUF805 family)
MAGSIFISYRREDSQGATGRLHDRLLHHFDNAEVFMDVDGIEPGVDFVEVLDEHLKKCTALIAVIGPDWLNAKDHTGRRRLDDANDYVRLEVEAALKRNVRVIPVLVDGADMPRSEELPESLSRLARRQAVELTHKGFVSGVDELAKSIKRALNKEAAPVQPATPQARIQKWIDTLFSFKGRISRKTYFLSAAGLYLLFLLGVFFFAMFTSMIGGEEEMQSLLLASAPYVWGYSMWPVWALMLKRFHDLGWGGPLVFVPIVGLGLATNFASMWGDTDLSETCLGFYTLFGFAIGLFKGTAGPNQYGPDPLAGLRQTPAASMA